MLSEKTTEHNYGVEFRGEITKITKYYRGRYDLKLSINGINKILLSDYDFELYKKKIKSGDLVIKSNNANCFYYKRKEISLAENCTNIREIDTMPLCK